MLRKDSTDGRFGLKYKNAPLKASASPHTRAIQVAKRNFSKCIKAIGFPKSVVGYENYSVI